MDIPAGVILGIACGLLGALFIHVNVNINIVRKRLVNTNGKKIFEACAFAFVTASMFYMVVALRKLNCKPDPANDIAAEELFRFQCSDGYYSPLATLIFNTEGGTIR